MKRAKFKQCGQLAGLHEQAQVARPAYLGNLDKSSCSLAGRAVRLALSSARLFYTGLRKVMAFGARAVPRDVSDGELPALLADQVRVGRGDGVTLDRTTNCKQFVVCSGALLPHGSHLTLQHDQLPHDIPQGGFLLLLLLLILLLLWRWLLLMLLLWRLLLLMLLLWRLLLR